MVTEYGRFNKHVLHFLNVQLLYDVLCDCFTIVISFSERKLFKISHIAKRKGSPVSVCQATVVVKRGVTLGLCNVNSYLEMNETVFL